MNLHMILVVGLVLIVTGCSENEQVVSEPLDGAGVTDAAAANESWQNEAFLEHMHHHAEKLDDINYALADGRLEAAKRPASWLSRHPTVDDVQPDWLQYLYGMRAAAEAVETATDLATARDAAARINAQCQGCHAAAGVSVE